VYKATLGHTGRAVLGVFGLARSHLSTVWTRTSHVVPPRKRFYNLSLASRGLLRL
jgi:hypothetical protein